MTKRSKSKSVLFNGSQNLISPPNFHNTNSKSKKPFSIFEDSMSQFNLPKFNIDPQEQIKKSQHDTNKIGNDCRLTESEKRTYKNLIPKCEMCKAAPGQDVHHIKSCKNGGRKIYSNLIVLCGTHHKMAHGEGGMIPQTKLKECIQKRPKETAEQIKSFLKMKRNGN